MATQTQHAIRVCTVCNVSKSLDCFEQPNRIKQPNMWRKVCKPCYAAQKKERAKASTAHHNRESVPKPSHCSKCGRAPPDVDFKWRTDVVSGGWRPECNACFNAKLYWQTSRQKRRAADEEAYLAHNAAVHLAWAQNNPDKIAAQVYKSKTDTDRRWKYLLTYLRSKHGEDWESHVDLSGQEQMTDMLSESCKYCGHIATDVLNGLDRVNPLGKYCVDNVVPCCSVCNAMKNTMHVDEFIYSVRAVVNHNRGDPRLDVNAARPPPFGKNKQRCLIADSKSKAMQLSADEARMIKLGSCYLCGRAPAFGIDRVDSRQGYTMDNCRSCCTHCNYMKKDWTLEEFLGHMARISVHTHEFNPSMSPEDFGAASLVPGERQPVVVTFDTGERLVFPSICTASTLLGRPDCRTIANAIEAGRRYLGMSWSLASNKEFQQQSISQDVALRMVERLLANKHVRRP